jgi:GNAT superfamily N-acetyltransferase
LTLGRKTVANARIRQAEAADAPALTVLALASKAAWGYDAAFMAACRAELTVEAEELGDPTFVLEAKDRILGFYQLRLQGTGADVRLFFVAPDAMRSGIGRRLWAHLERTARAIGVTRLEIDSDPHAEGFYTAMGMRRTGHASSGSIAGRMLPHLVKEL